MIVRWARGHVRLAAIALWMAGSSASGAPPRGTTVATDPARAPDSEATPTAPRKGALPPADAEELLAKAHHLRVLAGDTAAAERILVRLQLGADVPRAVRARAVMWLAEMAELGGDRRRVFELLEQVKELVGPEHALSLEADDQRARILTATPLADVRGPVPGSLALADESAAVNAAFRRAEGRLAAYHRVVVAPRLENMNAVLKAKRGSIESAVGAYMAVLERGDAAAHAAAHFRIGALHHHFAEALAFAVPGELLPSVAEKLRRELQAESTVELRRALAHYEKAAATKNVPQTSPWRQLARREATTLGIVLGGHAAPAHK